MMYADPGSGAMIWQLGLALFFGGAFFFSRVKEWARGIFKKDSTHATADSHISETE